MSQPPSFNSPPPLAYDSPVLSSLPARPVSVTVISIIVIVFASFGLLCSPFALIPLFVKTPGQPNPVLELMHSNVILRAWSIISVVVGVVLSAIKLYAAIGSLKLKPPARKLMVALACVDLVLVLLNLGVTIFITMPPMMAMIHAADPAVRAGAIAGLIGGFVGALFGCILPALTLYFFQTPYVINAFEGRRVYPAI